MDQTDIGSIRPAPFLQIRTFPNKVLKGDNNRMKAAVRITKIITTTTLKWDDAGGMLLHVHYQSLCPGDSLNISTIHKVYFQRSCRVISPHSIRRIESSVPIRRWKRTGPIRTGSEVKRNTVL